MPTILVLEADNHIYSNLCMRVHIKQACIHDMTAWQEQPCSWEFLGVDSICVRDDSGRRAMLQATLVFGLAPTSQKLMMNPKIPYMRCQILRPKRLRSFQQPCVLLSFLFQGRLEFHSILLREGLGLTMLIRKPSCPMGLEYFS